MIPEEIAEKAIDSPNSHRYKCKVRDNQEVGRWKKSEHENFIKGNYFYEKQRFWFFLLSLFNLNSSILKNRNSSLYIIL